MKRIWARVGMSVLVTDEEYEKLRAEAEIEEPCERRGARYGDLDVPDWLYKKLKFFGRLDGDAYIPQSEFEEDSDD